eukprot:4119751-Pleurochrysis_carterae.AAC.1
MRRSVRIRVGAPSLSEVSAILGPWRMQAVGRKRRLQDEEWRAGRQRRGNPTAGRGRGLDWRAF